MTYGEIYLLQCLLWAKTDVHHFDCSKSIFDLLNKLRDFEISLGVGNVYGRGKISLSSDTLPKGCILST